MGTLGYQTFRCAGWLSVATLALSFAFACSSAEPSGGPGAGAAAHGGDGAEAGGATAPTNGGRGEGASPGAAGADASTGAAGPGEGGAGGEGAQPAAGGAGGEPTEVETSFWSLTPHASPLTVTYTLETASRVIKALPITGGTLSTTAQDGTQFTLTVPSDALFSPETIVMTPVKLDEQPFGDGPAWGVELLPDGLHFNQPVKLVITPPPAQVPPVAEQLAFGWSGPANQVVLANPDPEDDKLGILLLHFSSYAYATAKSGVSSSLAGLRSRIGGSAEARIHSAAAEVLGAERQRQLLGIQDMALATAAEIERLKEEFEKEVVEPRVAAAGDSCAAARLAFETLLGFERQMMLLGVEVTSEVLFGSLSDTLYNVCLDEEWALCRDEHIVQRIIPVYLSFDRQHQLLGGESTGTDWQAKGLDYISKCHRFRLEFNSSGSSNCEHWSFHEDVEGDIALEASGPFTSIMGTGTLASTEYSMSYTQCTNVSNIVQKDATLLVNGLDWNLKTDPLQPGKGEIADFTLTYFPFAAEGSTHVAVDTCAEPPDPPATIQNFYWSAIYGITTVDDPAYFNEASGWLLKGWQVKNNGGATLAEKDFNPTLNDDGIVYGSPTSVVLVHTPG